MPVYISDTVDAGHRLRRLLRLLVQPVHLVVVVDLLVHLLVLVGEVAQLELLVVVLELPAHPALVAVVVHLDVLAGSRQLEDRQVVVVVDHELPVELVVGEQVVLPVWQQVVVGGWDQELRRHLGHEVVEVLRRGRWLYVSVLRQLDQVPVEGGLRR